MTRCRQIFCCMIAVLLVFAFSPLPAHAQKEKIRVGYYEDGDYMSLNENGEYAGFNIEYLEKIARYTDWEYEIVDCRSWDNTLQMLKDGKIDLLPAVYYTEERARELLLSNLKMCDIYSTLNVRADDDRYHYEDFESFGGMKVGVIKNSVDAANFGKYCEGNGIELEIIPYEETGELLGALADGMLDGVAITHLGKNSTFRSVAQFSPEPLYIALAPGRERLLRELNQAQSQLKLRDPYYEAELYDKYFSVSIHQQPAFTAEEQEFIDHADKIKAVYGTADMPIEFNDPETGEFAGIARELFQSIENQTGLEFEFIPAATRAEAFGKIKNGEADVICSVVDDYLWAREHGLDMTGSYLRSPLVAVTTKHRNGEIIALPEGYWFSREIAKDNPGRTIKYYVTFENCFDALLSGQADVTFTDTYVADYLLSDIRYEQFSVVTLSGYVEEISIGVSKSADPRLFAILDRCVQYTSTEAIDEIVLQNSVVRQEITLDYLIHRYPAATIGIVVLVFAAVTGVLGYILRTKSKNNKTIRDLLYRDRLTGAGNLNQFRMDAEKVMEEKTRGEYAVVSADIEQFKAINDAFGFTEGDEVLRSLAAVLERSVTEEECYARVSADRFVLLLRYGGWEELAARTASIGREMEEWAENTKRPYSISMIFGVYIVQDAEKFETSLAMDFANYARWHAKTTRAAQTVLYDETMRREELRQRHLSDIMKGALKNGEFVPYYQPKVNMCTGDTVGAEALVRWIRPDGEMQMPGSFLPFFEQNGFIVEIDLHIFEETCRLMKEWADSGIAVKTVSCNFSRRHFKNPSFARQLAGIADRFGVPHGLLEVEITESIVMEDIYSVRKCFGQLKELGFKLAIDDFGAGYSSLGLLEQLDVDVIKLDRSFIRSESKKIKEEIVVRGVVAIASELGMEIVCEGVETKEQADMLVRVGCLIAQGFYYARPMPAGEFRKRLHGAQ